MAPSCASTVPLQVVTTLAVARPLGSGADAAVESVVAAASLGTEASLPVDMPGGREGLEGDTDAQGSARRRSGLAHTSTRRVATLGSQSEKVASVRHRPKLLSIEQSAR